MTEKKTAFTEEDVQIARELTMKAVNCAIDEMEPALIELHNHMEQFTEETGMKLASIVFNQDSNE